MIYEFGTPCPKCGRRDVSPTYYSELTPEVATRMRERYDNLDPKYHAWAPIPPSAREEHLEYTCACGHSFWTRTSDWREPSNTFESGLKHVLYIAPDYDIDNPDLGCACRVAAALVPMSKGKAIIQSALWRSLQHCTNQLIFYDDNIMYSGFLSTAAVAELLRSNVEEGRKA